MNKLSPSTQKIMNRLGIICLLLMATLFGVNAQNLIPNHGFENGTGDAFTNWSKPNGPSSLSATTTSGEFRSGARALKAVVASSAADYYFVQMLSDLIPTTIGTSYTFKVWVKGVNPSTKIRISTQPSALYSSGIDVTTGWTQLSWTFTANVANTRIALDLGKDANTFFLDDMELTASNTASLLNPGFEEGSGDNFDDWTKPNGPSSLSATTTSGEFRSGARALKAVVASSAADYYFVQMLSDLIPTTIGTSYTFKVWVKGVNPSTKIRISTQPSALYSSGIDVTTGWTQLSWTFTANVANTRIALDLGKDANTFFLDDMELLVIPPPTGLQNPDFELGSGDVFTDWVKNGSATFSQATTAGEFHKGSRGVKAVVASSGQFYSSQLITSPITTTIGTSYTFKMWAKTSSNITPSEIKLTTNAIIGTNQNYDLVFKQISTTWTQYSWTFNATSALTEIVINIGQNANTYFIDDTEFAVTPPPSGLQNPDFELGTGDVFTSWVKQNGASSLVQTTTVGEFHKGVRGLKAVVTGTQSNAPNPWSVQLISTPITTVVGKTYNFKIWAKTATNITPSEIKLTVNEFRGNNQIYTLASQQISDTWTQYTWSFIATTTSTDLALNLGKDANTYFVDDMEFGPSSGSLLNGGFELGGPGDNFTNWGKYNGPTYLTETTVSSEVYSGLRALKATVPSGLADYQVQMVSDNINTVIGRNYTFKIYVKAATAGAQQIQFSTKPQVGAIYSGNKDVTTDWTEITFNFTAYAAQTQISLDLGANQNTYYLDEGFFDVDCVTQFVPPSTQMPIATGKNKFLGCIYSTAQIPNADKYFNQVAPENSGKWGEVEGTEGVYNFAAVDAARAYAKTNNFPFRFHVLLWGSQQPLWLKPMNDVQKVAKIKAWMQAVANHYDGSTNARAKLEYIEVLNEALNDPPNNTTNPHPTYGFPGADNTNDGGSGDYVNALKSLNTELGTTPGTYDWIVNSFKLARQYFGCETKLMINEYAIENTPLAMADYTTIIQLLKDDNLVDVVGMQTHTFGTRVYSSTHPIEGPTMPADFTNGTANLTANLNTLAAKGFPVMITEFDIDGDVSLNPSGARITTGTQADKDAFQASEYQRIFNVYWNHPSVIGITLWGYRTGHWRSANAAYIMDPCSGAERPAMTFLNTTIRASTPPALSTSFNVTGVMKSKQTGDWSDPATWSCGRLPIVTEDVTISSGHIVNIIDANAKAKKVNNSGQLNFSNSVSKLGLME
jgi:GH35 family endo-1,4-beta-xylanase